jgi:hypothetical protein
MKVLKLVLALVICSSTVFGQNIIEEERLMAVNGMQNAYVIEIASSDKKAIEKSWSSYLKKYKGKTKKNKKTGEFFTDNATLKNLSSNTVDIYSKLSPSGDKTVLMVWFDLGGAYLSSTEHPEKTTKGQAVLLEFGATYETKVDMAALKVQEDALKDLKNEQKKLVKDHASHDAEIEKLKARIIELEQKKVDNLKMQAEKEKAIKAQVLKVQAANEKVSN